MKLFVGGLSWDTTDDGLREAFSRFGSVTEAKVVTDRETGRSRGFGFVGFQDASAGASAQQAMDGASLDGRTIRVNAAEDKPGGGRGGGGGGGGGYGGGGGGSRGFAVVPLRGVRSGTPMNADAPPIAADDFRAGFSIAAVPNRRSPRTHFLAHGLSAAIGGASAYIGVPRPTPAQRERRTERREE